MRIQKGERGGTSDAAGRLMTRPTTPVATLSPGEHHLQIDAGHGALLYVPAGYDGISPAPFVLSLHGAGGTEFSGQFPLRELADDAGLILLSPASRDRTWDVIIDRFGPDVNLIDRALAEAFSRCAVDRDRIAIAGFSDGASYALSLGLRNGDLFGQVMAFSPGFIARIERVGEPRIFVSHGTSDQVLPIEHTSRRIVPGLRRAGYAVEYREFEGGHTVPPVITREAVDWFLGP
jgi:phospholipase/carboxylesterase